MSIDSASILPLPAPFSPFSPFLHLRQQCLSPADASAVDSAVEAARRLLAANAELPTLDAKARSREKQSLQMISSKSLPPSSSSPVKTGDPNLISVHSGNRANAGGDTEVGKGIESGVNTAHAHPASHGAAAASTGGGVATGGSTIGTSGATSLSASASTSSSSIRAQCEAIRSAMLLEQAALCYEQAGVSHRRRRNFQLVMAGHTYYKAGKNKKKKNKNHAKEEKIMKRTQPTTYSSLPTDGVLSLSLHICLSFYLCITVCTCV